MKVLLHLGKTLYSIRRGNFSIYFTSEFCMTRQEFLLHQQHLEKNKINKSIRSDFKFQCLTTNLLGHMPKMPNIRMLIGEQ